MVPRTHLQLQVTESKTSCRQFSTEEEEDSLEQSACKIQLKMLLSQLDSLKRDSRKILFSRKRNLLYLLCRQSEEQQREFHEVE